MNDGETSSALSAPGSVFPSVIRGTPSVYSPDEAVIRTWYMRGLAYALQTSEPFETLYVYLYT